MPSARIQLVFLRGYRTAFAFDSGIFGALKEMLTEGPVSGLSGIHFVSTEPLEGVILNILLYIPMGYLLPVLWSSLAQGKWMWKILLAGFAASLLTEIVQLILRLGWFDVDDLLNNMLGILAGLWLYRKFLAEMHIFYAMDVDAIWTLGKRALVAYGIMCAGYFLVSWLIAHITYVKAHNASVSFDRMLTEIDGSEEEEE